MKFIALRREMAGTGITQKQLAKLIGLGEKSMSFKMTGKREFLRSEMLNICKVFGKTLSELFSEE